MSSITMGPRGGSSAGAGAEATLAQIEELIPACVTEVLETMFFAEAEPASGLSPEEIESYDRMEFYPVVVDFAGQPSGRFWIRAARVAAMGLAADFLGLDREEIDEGRGLEVALELSNMLCGSVVSRVEADSAFALSPPRLAESDEDARQAPSSYARFVVGGGLIQVTCTLA